MKSFLRKLHRWLGLLMALQIIAWMGSGLYFSVFPIEVIRGEHLTRAQAPPVAAELAGSITAEQAWQAAISEVPRPRDLGAMTLVRRWEENWFQVNGTAGGQPFRRMVNARTGQVRQPLDAEGARRLADSLLKQPGGDAVVDWIETTPPGSEIRGRELPLWRVRYTHPESLSLYLDPWTGDLLARRTTRWRLFDFLWMLHIMDFDERDDFNTPLLQVAAGLGFLVAFSGVVFWAVTSRLFRRRRFKAG